MTPEQQSKLDTAKAEHEKQRTHKIRLTEGWARETGYLLRGKTQEENQTISTREDYAIGDVAGCTDSEYEHLVEQREKGRVHFEDVEVVAPVRSRTPETAPGG